MEQTKVDILYINGFEKTYETTFDNSEELKRFLDIISGFYNGVESGYIRLPNFRTDEIVFIDLKKTMSITVSKKDLFNQ